MISLTAKVKVKDDRCLRLTVTHLTGDPNHQSPRSNVIL